MNEEKGDEGVKKIKRKQRTRKYKRYIKKQIKKIIFSDSKIELYKR